MLYISGDFYNHLDMTFWHKITIGHNVETVNIYQNVQGMIVYKQQSLRSFNSLALLQKKSFSLCSPETSWTAILLLASLTNW